MAPGNDLFANATNLDESTLPGSLSGQTNFDATKEATEPAFKSNDQSVWYRFIPDVTGWYKFWIEADHVEHNGRGIALVLGSPTTLAGYTTAAVETYVEQYPFFSVAGWWTVAGYLTSGTTYHIKVYSGKPGTINDETADFTLHWDVVDTPANDDFADALPLTLPASLTVDTYDSTSEAGEPAISPGFYSGMQSQWFTITTASAGWYTARLLLDDAVHTGNALGDPPSYVPGFMYVQVFNATVDTLAEATEANALAVDSLSLNSSSDTHVQFEVPSAGTYYIRVSTPFLLKSTGDGLGRCFNQQAASTTLEVEAIPAPANDDFADAEVVTTSPLVGTTYGATEEATEPSLWGTVDQSVWYEFSPPSDGDYMFAIDEDNVTSHATVEDNWELYWAVFDSAVVTTLADATYENMFPAAYNYTQMEFGNGYAAIICQGMLAANTYWIKVAGRMTSSFNARTSDFELDWALVPPPDNDDFANAEAIGSATGNTTGTCLNSSFEVDEPPSFYWNGPGQTVGTVWYDWTCPATGNYVFKVESTNAGDQQDVNPVFDLAIWQGSTLAGLTKVARNWAGSQNITGVRDNQAATAIGFHGTSGQHYKIQIANGSELFAPDHKLSWRTNVVTGNTTATALAFPDGRIDNYGNDDTEPPPNFATILASHDSWWFDDGQVGGVKWFKRVFSGTEQVEIRGVQFDGSDYGTNVMSTGDIGLICYKGANYASLVVADESGTSDDAAMMVVSSDFLPGGIDGVRASFTNMGQTRDYMLVDCDPGETLWMAVFGLMDIDSGATAGDATQFEIDVHVPTPAPLNDVWDYVWDDDTYLYNLTKARYPEPDGLWAYAPASGREGTTLGATADVGELARASFVATRSVWYYLDFDYEDFTTWTLTVDSPVDCVLAIYEIANGSGDLGPILLQDDDSGTGNNPLLTFIPHTDLYNEDLGWGYAVVVDSKTEGIFDLLLTQETTGTPPANDDWEDAEIHIGGFPTLTGTTIGATAEPFEGNSEELGEGPKDTVWYKWTPGFSGQVKIWGRCLTDNLDGYIFVDMWQGDSLKNLVRVPEPPQNWPRGRFSFGDSDAELRTTQLIMDVVSGQDYYIRIQTESGGSEDFEVYIELSEVYLSLSVSSLDVGPYDDFAQVYLSMVGTASEVFHGTSLDAATVPLTITPITAYEEPGVLYTDSATVYFNLSNLGGECYSTYSAQLLGEGEADLRWLSTSDEERWVDDDELRWDEGDVTLGEGVHC